MSIKRVAIFISGKGSNAINLIQYFKLSKEIKIIAVLSTKDNSTVKQCCAHASIQYDYLPQNEINPIYLLDFCNKNNVDWIILAGFLKKIPIELVHKFPNKIINLHPALLPKFGGKGMYGMNVHEAVITAKENYSGITIHFVNEEFDEGEIIAQFVTFIDSLDTPQTLYEKIHNLEIKNFPKVVEDVILSV